MRENQKRKRTMQQIAKGGPQKSGVKKPTPAKPAGATRPSIGNVRGPAGRGRPDSAQAKDTKNWQKLNQSASAKAGKAAEPKPRTPAPGTGNVLQSAIDRSKSLKDSARQANRSRVATRDAARASGAKGAVAALAGAAAEKVLGPVARKVGGALANRVLIPAARKLDDAMPGVNSKDEAKRRNAQAAAKGSTSKFKGARDVAIKKASAPKPKPSTQKAGPAMPDRLKSAPPAPKLPAASRRPASPARPAAAAKPKAPAAKPAAAKPKVAKTTGIGPMKAGDSYSRKINSLQEQLRKLREMRADSIKRQGK